MDIDLLLVQVVEQPEGGGEQEKRPKTSADKSEDDSVTGALSDQEPPKEVIKTERIFCLVKISTKLLVRVGTGSGSRGERLEPRGRQN